MKPLFYKFSILVFIAIFGGAEVYAACGGTVRTWDADANTNRWDTVINWSGDDQPDTASEDAVIVSASRPTQIRNNTTVGCFEVQSGEFRSRNGRTLTVTGDYFRAKTANMMFINANHDNFRVEMAGTGPQTYEAVDEIPRLRISNNTTVTITESMSLEFELEITGTTSTVYIDNDLSFQPGADALVIPAGTTLQVRSGATLTTTQNITVNGTLILDAGTSLSMANGTTLDVTSTGNIQINGASGNTARITGTGSGDSFTFNMAGLMTAQYFRLDRMSAAGLNLTGTISSMDYGEFHYIANAGNAITIGAAAVIPSSVTDIGFFDDDAHGNTGNINATAYSGSAMTVNNWSGGVGGAGFETDPNTVINWGSQAGTQLILSDNTASGFPPATILQASGDTLFATYAFSLNQSSAGTNITSIKVTQVGTASSSDVASVKLFRDGGGGTACVYDAGVDIQIDTDMTLSGSPASATFSVTPGDVSTNSDSDIQCVHVIAGTTGTAQDAKTIRFSIEGTSDVVNSQGYSFSSSSGPPVAAGSSEIQGDIPSIWQGDVSTDFSVGQNWDGPAPNATRDCRIGSGLSVPVLNVNPRACQNATLSNGGSLDFNASNTFEIYGNLEVESGFTFTNLASGIIDISGAANQNISFSTAFPASLTVTNTGTAPDNKVSVGANSEIQGNITVTSGVLSVPNGITLTVGGNLTVQTGATLEILPGGTVSFGNGSTLTVDSGGVLTMVGTSGLKSKITGTTGASYNVIINGEIEAQHYIFERMGTAGISIEAGATIDAVYYLQDGSFTYPSNSSTTMLALKRQIPGNTIDSISFDLNGSPATGVTNIDTTGAAAGTLTISSYSGDLGGPSFDTDPSYAISWNGATNTLTITDEAFGPSTVEAGSSAYVMGRYGFVQTLAGASYSDADVTQLILQLTGTGSASDVSEIRIYADSNCDSSAGVLIGTGTYSGNPARSTFNIPVSNFTVAADTTTPPMNCIYVEYDIAGAAADGKTVGVSIANSTDQTNSQSYASAGSISFPLTLGNPATIQGATSTTWTGSTDTDWGTPGNWTNGVPDATKNCTIGNVATDPTIGAAGGICKNVDITNGGNLTFQNAVSAQLDVHGSFISSGTVTQNDGVLRFIDAGAGLSQTLNTSHTISNFQIEKTGGGTVSLSANTTTMNTLTFNGSNTGTIRIQGGKVLVLPNGVSIPNGTLQLTSSSELQIGNGQTITLNGGTFQIAGVQDAYPQNESLKGKVTVQGAGQWGFTATSGTLNLVGFILDYMDDNGLNVGGTTNFSNFQSGKFTNLSTNYASMTAMQLNTSSVPASPTSIEWHWGPNNTPPAEAAAYLIGSSTGCGSNTISFDAWYGDWFDAVNETPDTNTKISESNCDIVISWANSPVSLLSFEATSFDSNVLLEWVTGSETNHQGFNVYRSQQYDEGYVQLNGDLIRNLYTGAGPQGYYRFEDKTAINGQVYYYMIEDVSATGGIKELHGPVWAMPLTGLGSPAPPGGGVNDGESDSGADTGNGPGATPIDNIGEVDLGHGVHILSQTDSSIRIEIIPPALSISASVLDGAYDVLSMPGYSSSLEATEPQMLEKVVLIEVVPYRSTAQISAQTIVENATLNPHQIQAVPDYVFDGNGGATPSHNPNATTYALNADLPADGFYSLTTDIKTVGQKKYVELKINPILYNPSTSTLRSLQKLTLDIGLDGSAWTAPSPSPNLSLSPATVPGVLRIRLQEAGMYELLFDDIAAAGLDAYLAGVDTDDLRLYDHGIEMPIEVVSGDSVFGAGDSVRFYTSSVKSLESNYSEVVLSPWSLGDQQASALRYVDADANPGAAPASSYASSEAKVFLEQDLRFLNDRQLGDLEDHIFWGRLGKWTDSRASYWPEFMDISVALPDLDETLSHDVRVKVRVRGRHQFLKNGDSKIELQINANPNMSSSVIFNEFYPTTVDMIVPSEHLIAGTNNFRFHVGADHLAGLDWALLDIDHVEVFYMADTRVYSAAKELYKVPFDESFRVSGFGSSNINIYDFSDHEQAKKYSNYNVSSSDGNVTYDVDMKVDSSISEDLGYLIYAIEDGQYKTPVGLFMSEGYEKSLVDTDNRADLIVIGNDEFLASSSRLIEERESEGLSVMEVTLDQIYSEFSHGIPNVRAIRDFLLFAKDNWSLAPRYVLLLGDSTTDLRGKLGGGDQSHLPPIPMISGDYIDYGSDSWYATRDGEIVPFLALGRIPATNQAELEDYITKILKFETGEAAPEVNAKQLGFYSDTDTLYEQFAQKTDNLASTSSSANSALTTYHKKFDDYATIPLFKADISSDFNDGPLMMGFVGHGYDDQWADDVFNVTDAAALTNNKLPMAMGMNCSTGMFYGQDLSSDSLGEALVMNPNGGSIMYWGSTTLTVPETQMKLSQNFYYNMSSKLASGQSETRLGDLTLLAKTSMASQGTAKDALQSYSLLGDPSMQLPANSFEPVAPSSDDGGGGCGMVAPSSGSGPGPWAYLILLLPMFVLTRLRKLSLNP